MSARDPRFLNHLPHNFQLYDANEVCGRMLKAVKVPRSNRKERQQALLNGSRLAYSAMKAATKVDLFVNATHVKRTAAEIEKHLKRLIAPDHLDDVRSTICDELGITELQELAFQIAELHARFPDVASALLELNLGRASHLLKRYQTKAGVPLNADYSCEFLDMGRVRLAFYLRLLAEECGAQIHAPYGYQPLDDLQQFGTLRCSTATAALRQDLNEAQQACSLFLRHYKRPLFAKTSAVPLPVTGTALDMVFAGMNFMISEADAAPYRDPKLQERALAELAFWRTKHKERLEDHLRNVILDLLAKMVVIRSQLEDRASELGANAVLGNADQENAGLVLWMAVEAAVAWTAGHPYRSERSYVEALEDAVSGPWMGKVVAATLGGENTLYEHPPELKPEHASVVTQLFDVYRIAFLQDDNMLPLWMRTIAVPALVDDATFALVQQQLTVRRRTVTAPRHVNGPALLSAIGRCGQPGCDRHLTKLTGKGGRYAYYACAGRAYRATATCAGVRMRVDALDDIVLTALEERVLEPERLKLLLAEFLDLSAEGVDRKRGDLALYRAERTRTEKAIAGLYDLVEAGLDGPANRTFADRLATHQKRLTSVEADIAKLERQVETQQRQITPEIVEHAAALIRARLRGSDTRFLQAYVRTLIDEVVLSPNAIEIRGPKAALERLITIGAGKPTHVPAFDREWCPEEDSNLHDLAIAST